MCWCGSCLVCVCRFFVVAARPLVCVRELGLALSSFLSSCLVSAFASAWSRCFSRSSCSFVLVACAVSCFVLFHCWRCLVVFSCLEGLRGGFFFCVLPLTNACVLEGGRSAAASESDLPVIGPPCLSCPCLSVGVCCTQDASRTCRCGPAPIGFLILLLRPRRFSAQTYELLSPFSVCCPPFFLNG